MLSIKKTLLAIIEQHIPTCKIILFGSRARQTHANGADFDIGIDAGIKIPHKTMLQISSAIEDSNIPVLVDIVDLNNVSESFLAEITKDAVIWKQK
jgi:predicted nucleotidyltransferase